ncbi:T9SS type A sorting domain-containing protein [candidate division KSB1 bacterium]|nr:T9SS type A sorting domain-containing protein [candidate division KSB1 bacterium]
MRFGKPTLFLVFLSSFSASGIAPGDLEQIQQAIEEKNADWTAAENWVTRLSPEEQRRLCGADLALPSDVQQQMIRLQPRQDLPSRFDWRDHNGNWVTPVKDQADCGSCVAFAAAGSLEAWWRIHHADLDSIPDLSEQFMLSCTGMSCSEGWRTDLAYDFLIETGLPPETCLPYTASDQTLCDEACADYEQRVTRIPGWGWVTLYDGSVENIKNAVALHPVMAAFQVYDDFFSYRSGVYEHVWGEEAGGHAIVIVGWDDATQSWICKNSWNSSWGMDGFFQIRWGECGMNNGVMMIYDNLTEGAAAIVSPAALQLEGVIGDQLEAEVTIHNPTQNSLQYAAFPQEIKEMAFFHRSNFLARSDSCWWNGDERMPGYGDGWLQFLETPTLDLSAAIAPQLVFWINYAVEDPANATTPYDGWDGCNVWGSTDGGQTYSILYSTEYPYTCTSLYSFGHSEQGWNMGAGIPGWAGTSDGWRLVSFDLSDYAVEQARFHVAFASDMGHSSIDDPQLFGVCVDDIRIWDDSELLFSDQDSAAVLRSTGRNHGTEPALWITLKNGAGMIVPADSIRMSVKINTRNLVARSYQAVINFSSNHATQTIESVPIDLTLIKPQHDLAIGDIVFEDGAHHLFSETRLGVRIDNWGLEPEENVEVAVAVSAVDQTFVLEDTLVLERIDPDNSATGLFKPFIIRSSKPYSCRLHLIGREAIDYNSYNNADTLAFVTSNLVTNFEKDHELLECQGGWGITDKLNRHSGTYMAHVQNGEMPYAPNSDAVLTYTRPFHIAGAQALTLSYWARWGTQADRDVGYLEISPDSLTWSAVDSVSGNGPRFWSQREIDLTRRLDEWGDKLWMRFRFISDDADHGIGLGVLIDDVEIFHAYPTDVAPMVQKESTPDRFGLSQNYPNPFNASTTIRYVLPQPSPVQVRIFDLLGQEIAVLVDDMQGAGEHTVSWDGRTVTGRAAPSGIYLCQLSADNQRIVRKMVLVR